MKRFVGTIMMIRDEIAQVQAAGIPCYRYGFMSRSGFLALLLIRLVSSKIVIFQKNGVRDTDKLIEIIKAGRILSILFMICCV